MGAHVPWGRVCLARRLWSVQSRWHPPCTKTEYHSPHLWYNLSMENIHWVAGLIEGEGSIMVGSPSRPNQPELRCEMTDEDVIQRLANELGATVHKKAARQENWKPTYVVSVRNATVVPILLELRPHMGIRRQEQIDRAVASYENLRGKLTPQQRLEIVKRFSDGESAKSLAQEFGITHWNVYRLKNK